MSLTPSQQSALNHLRSIKPNDGWSIQSVEKDQRMKCRLLRRNVPLFDNYFLDIHYCPNQKVVVGILTKDGSVSQILVDSSGKPMTTIQVISVMSTYDPSKRTTPPTTTSTASSTGGQNYRSAGQRRTSSSSSADSGPALIPNMSPEESQRLVQYALLFIAGLILLKILSDSTIGSLLVLAIPLVYVYGLQTCPYENSFDAKKELKRVLRGQHLPDDHPNKPKGFLEEMAARVAASVTTELATLPGYELQMTNLAGAGWIADMRIPTAKLQCFWIGVFHRWIYICSFDIPERPSSTRST